MGSDRVEETLWTNLEIAVRTHTAKLPVDAFLPDPRERVERLIQERLARKRTVSPEEQEFFQSEASFPGTDAETPKSFEPPPAAEKAPSLDDELRSRLSGNTFADLDDV